MKFQRLLSIAAFVCLIAFLNVPSFAQTTGEQADPARLMAKITAQILRAEGYAVRRRGNSVEVDTAGGVLALAPPAALQVLEGGEVTHTLDRRELGAYATTARGAYRRSPTMPQFYGIHF